MYQEGSEHGKETNLNMEENITAIVAQSKEILKKNAEQQKRNAQSLACSQKVTSLRATFRNAEDFIERYNPDRQSYYLSRQYEAYTGSAPSFYILDQAFGKNTSKSWVLAQLFNLSEFCGCKDKLDTSQLKQTADIIVSGYYKNLKVSELSLFFAKVKQGIYGRFYGSVDPMQITSSLYEFVKNRGNEIVKYEEKL